MQEIKNKLKGFGLADSTTKTYLNILQDFFLFKALGWHRSRWFGCHALRHAFCIYCLDEKIGDYDQVSDWLGHSVSQTTKIYTQCRRKDYIESIAKYKEIICFIR